MPPTRREVLLAAAAPLVLGHPLPRRLAAQDPTEPDPLEPALLEMRRRGVPCLAIAVPFPYDRRAQIGLSDALLALAEPPELDGLALWARAVVACVPLSRWPVPSCENVMLVDAGGARLRGTRVDWQEPRAAARAAHALLDAERLARPAAAPLPFERWSTTRDPEERAALEAEVVRAVRQPLPFGVTLAKREIRATHCGVPVDTTRDPHEYRWVCGTAMLTRRATHFLSFATG